MTNLLDGKSVARDIRSEVEESTRELRRSGGRPPGLVAVLVGENPASEVYVRMKAQAAEEAGFMNHTLRLPADISQAALVGEVDRLNGDDEVDGVLVQLPLPKGLDSDPILARVEPEKDVDGFHPVSVGRLWLGQEGFVPATPAGIIELLSRSGIQLEGQRAVIIGRSAIVGKPLAGLLLRQHCTVTVCHSRTRDLPAVCRQADLVVAAIGRAAFVGPEFVKQGAVVVDVGINRIADPEEVQRLFPGDQKRRQQLERRGSILVGDVDFTRVAPMTSAITPVPGGVGPLTVAMLMHNTLKASRQRQGLTRPPR